jgi:hypothetical protein
MNRLRRYGKLPVSLGTALLMFSLLLAQAPYSAARAADGHGNNSNNAEARLRTSLAGGAIGGVVPSGNADFRMEASRNRSRLNVEVEHVNLPQGSMLQVSVTAAGTTTNIGTIKLDAFGSGELELNSEDGATVPAIVKGDVVTVKSGGKTILTGAF